MAGVRGRGARGERRERHHDRDRLAHERQGRRPGMVLAPTCSSSQALSGSAARHVEATCSSAVVAADARRARQRAARRPAPCGAAARRAGGRGDSRAARCAGSRRRRSRPPLRAAAIELGELRAAALVDDGGAEALELVAGQLVIARPGVEALRGQLARRGRSPGPGTPCSSPYVLVLYGADLSGAKRRSRCWRKTLTSPPNVWLSSSSMA